jgi:murein DD-endopeptidase MepM/ murein hydrolase activator NlpD
MRAIKNKKIVLFLAILFFAFLSFSKIRADDCHDGCDASYPNDASANEDCKNKCDDLQDKADTYQKIINLKNKQSKALSSQINDINQQQSVTQANLKETQKKVQDLSSQISSLENDISEKENSLNYDRKLLKNLMQSYFESDQEGVLSLVLLNKNFSEILTQTDQIGQSGAKINDMLAEIKNTKAELQKNIDDLQSKKSEHEKAKSDLEKQNLSLQYTENQKQTLLGQTEADKQKYQDLLDSIESEIGDLESGIASSADYSNIPPAKGGYFDYPVSSVKVTQGYGKTSYSNHYSSGKHNGVDFSINYGSVYAVKSGKVVGVGNNGRYAYGKWIAIDHGDGLVTLYGHFSKQLVSKGDKVSTGEQIGVSGNTGYSTGPHLHFSVFVKSSFDVVESKKVGGLMIPVGAPINPMKYFK